MSRHRGGDHRGGSNSINSVFYSDVYHPIQAGSIDGTDILPHDNGVYRALLCSSAGLYDPHGDPKIIGDPYNTLFVGHLSPYTNEDSLKKAMSRYGRVKNLRLVRHIVTGASQRYAFVEYETEREMQHAYEDAHHTFIDDSEIIVDFNRQQLMPGWIPRRLGGGLGGKKESGQLRFGGRERPFRAPLRPIPWDDLKRLGIPLPPEGQYMPRFEIPPLPRRRSPTKDQNAGVGEKYGRPFRRSSDSPGFSAERQFERVNISRSSKRQRERSNRESQHYEHRYSSDEDLRSKHQERHGSRLDHQLHQKQSFRRDHMAASSDTTETSYHPSDSIAKSDDDEGLGHRWNPASSESRRVKSSGGTRS